MGIFSSKKEGGLIDVIRCDEQEYLIWKWRPSGEANSTKKENSIRYGSSLRVKDGEVAVFVYTQNDGTAQDFIVGPFDKKIETANFPVLTAIVGLGWGGKSPFQAEIYFINLAGVIQTKFAIPYFDVYDPRFLDFGVPIAVHGSLTFNITDYQAFIKLHRMIDFEQSRFEKEIKETVARRVKGIVTNVPSDLQIPVVQLERKIMEISDLTENYLSQDLSETFGINVKRIDISSIVIDKESEGWIKLRKLTAGLQEKTLETQTEVSLKNMQDMQRINAQNMEESLRVQREELQRSQRLQSEQSFLGAHSIDQQAAVLKAAAENLGQMSQMNLGGNGDAGMNPAGMMTGMMMGGAMGQQMAGMMNNMGQQVQQSMGTPPPIPTASSYYIAVNGQQCGPCNMTQLQQMVQQGQMTGDTLVWKQGMPTWSAANTVVELASLFAAPTPPPIPGVPPIPNP